MIAFQAWVDKGVPDELGLSITHGADPDSGTVFLEFYGSWFGGAGGLDKALKGLIAGLPKEASLTTTGPFSNWIEGLVDADGSLDTTPPETVRIILFPTYQLFISPHCFGFLLLPAQYVLRQSMSTFFLPIIVKLHFNPHAE